MGAGAGNGDAGGGDGAENKANDIPDVERGNDNVDGVGGGGGGSGGGSGGSRGGGGGGGAQESSRRRSRLRPLDKGDDRRVARSAAAESWQDGGGGDVAVASAPFPGIGTKRSSKGVGRHFNDIGGVSVTGTLGDTSTIRRPHYFAAESCSPAKVNYCCLPQ